MRRSGSSKRVKLDAVVAPPVIRSANGILAEDRELRRFLWKLATVDVVFRKSLEEGNSGKAVRLEIKAAGLPEESL